MLKKKVQDVPSFVAGDATRLQEVVHPANDRVALHYSLARAELEPGTASYPHVLVKSDELYIFLEGKGIAFVDGEEHPVEEGVVMLVPKGAEQYVRNTGDHTLAFFCVVSPPWSKDQELVSKEK